MKQKRLFSMFIVALFVVVGVAPLAPAASTDELVAAANPEAQKILEKDVGHSLHLIPGTGAYNYVKTIKLCS